MPQTTKNLLIAMIISSAERYFTIVLKTNKREMARRRTTTTDALIFNQNYNKIMFFMIIYPLLINLKALKYKKSTRVSKNSTTPIREIYLILPH